jgi:hypothetical protein
MLHTLSHFLMTAIALESGYPAASLRERVYANEPARSFGILIYTGASDTGGTLGGLVEAGRRIAAHLAAALDGAGLCANDPICAEHQPERNGEGNPLGGAACHGCVLVAETSCEQRNDWLDRALVVPIVGRGDAAFFT